MTRHLTRQLALTSVLMTCILIVAIVVTLGLNGNTATALTQVAPLALVLSGALVFLVNDRAG